MIIAGAGGHAKEILDVLIHSGQFKDLFFFDNISEEKKQVCNEFPVLSTEKEALEHFKMDNRYSLAVGNPQLRKKLHDYFNTLGGCITSVISHTAIISRYASFIGEGLNVMHHAVINVNATVGRGCLINSKAEIHHDVEIGEFCEISPGAQLLGKVKVGHLCSIGAGAILLPGIIIGNNVIIGAGAVVTKNVADNLKVKGIPAM